LPQRAEALEAFVERVATELKQADVEVLMMMVFGAVDVQTTFSRLLTDQLGQRDCPLLWVEGTSCWNAPIAGVQVFLLPRSNRSVERILIGERVVGTVFRDRDAVHCFLADVRPADVSAPSADQVQQLLFEAEAALQKAGFTYADLARTWFYNDDILSWYDDFNRARTAFYAPLRFSAGSLPASTAVRGRNPLGAALTFAGWAVRPTDRSAVVREVASPLQCPAPAYGSSFSRAMEIISNGRKRLLISGTASIAPDGKTVWCTDVGKQIDLTMAVVDAILHSRGMGYIDVTRATAYFKNAADYPVFKNWLEVHGLQAMPVVPVHCDICRDDLLFEIELDAGGAG
jgi:enamine deaminase RidA (YjgF/YER057c/UK114 family)